MREILIINISGEDKPGVTNAVTSALAKYGVNILDIGQAVIHNTLNLGILTDLAQADLQSPLLHDVIQGLNEIGMQVRFEAISQESYSQWVAQQGKPRHIVTLLARQIRAEHLARVTELISKTGLNIDKITRLSGRVPLGKLHHDSKACVELSLRGGSDDITQLRSDLLELASEMDIDLAYQADDIYRRNRRLMVFDMDSTLIEAEVIDELANYAGVGPQVSAITEAAMRGELDFKQSFRKRLSLLAGLNSSVLEEIAANLKLTEGAERLFAILNRLGYKTAILSGGFTFFARRIQQKLGIDYVHANELDIVNGVVTGKVLGDIIDGQRKAALLKELAQKEGIALEQVIAVGDGANDLPMLNIAGLGIAYRAKPVVKASAKQSISQLGLDSILYLMGLSDRDTAY